MPQRFGLNDPRAQFDSAIAEMVLQTEDLQTTQVRLRGLLQASHAVLENVEVDLVLEQIIHAAVELVPAEHGAIAVVTPDGNDIESFVHTGMDDDTIADIAHLHEGEGLIGELVSDPQTSRPSSADDSRTDGSHDHDPALGSFLAVPILVRGSVFGHLYLTNKPGGKFSQTDEQLVEAFATTAGSAIDQARTLADARTRAQWMTSSKGLEAHQPSMNHLLDAVIVTERDTALGKVAEELIHRSDSRQVTIVVPGDIPGTLSIFVRKNAEGGVPVDDRFSTITTAANIALDDGLSRNIPSHRLDPDEEPDPYALVVDGVVGPTLYVALTYPDGQSGMLVIARLPSEPPLSPIDFDFALDLGQRITVAVALAQEIADAREAKQRVELFAERARIAQDLHDHVIQQLFGAGLELQGLATQSDPGFAGKLSDVVRRLDEAIAQIRTIIFALNPPDTGRTATTRHRVLDLAADASKALPHPIAVSFIGPIDLFVTGPVADDVTAVIRELLSNVVHHAGATQVSVAIRTDTDVRVTVQDDGIGIPDHTHGGNGLKNIRARAARYGGGVDISSSSAGTTTVWTVPIPSEDAPEA